MINVNKEQALNEILLSISKEESALAGLVEVERNKISSAIEYAKCNCSCENFDKLLELNRSAERLIGEVKSIETVLKEKARLAIDAMPRQGCSCNKGCGCDKKPDCGCNKSCGGNNSCFNLGNLFSCFCR